MTTSAKSTWTVNVTEDATGEVVESIPAGSERDAERIQRGVEINMNHNEFTCTVVGPVNESAA